MNDYKKQAYTRRSILQLSAGGALAAMGTTNNAAIRQKSTSKPSKKDISDEPPVTTRMFWTWDHSTEWMLNRPGAQTMGAHNDYTRGNASFVGDYTKLLEWCGRHDVNAVVVWGLLRDFHGGLASAKRLCEVADKYGVRLLCGVGLCCYGGVYFDGNSPYSLDVHLSKHPELKGIDNKGNPMSFRCTYFGPKLTHIACPSRKENQEYIAQSLRWLFQNLPSVGVQLESGDNGTCRCKLCLDRRQHPTAHSSWEDMALLYPIAIEAIRSVKPDALISCETYAHPEPWPDLEKQPGFGSGKPAWADECLGKIPEGVFVQWAGDQYMRPKSARTWTKAGTVSNKRHRNIMRAHFGTYWGGIRSELAIDWIADMVQQSVGYGFDAISLFGEVSPFHTGAELNYLALENYGSVANPKADMNVFLRDVAAPLLGGESHAYDYLRYARLKNEPSRIPEALKDIYKRCGRMPPQAARRWTWLANFLSSLAYRAT